MPTDQCTPIYNYEFGPTGLIGSNAFVDANDDGLLSRTARADKGDGVLFYDADGDGAISGEARFTRSDGSTGIVADMSLATDSESYRVVEGTTIKAVSTANSIRPTVLIRATAIQFGMMIDNAMAYRAGKNRAECYDVFAPSRSREGYLQ